MAFTASINGALRHIPAATIYLVGAFYAGLQFWQGLNGLGAYGVEPINVLERAYGEVALILIVAGLAITPLRTWTGISLIKFRRAVGVTAFIFVLAHFLVFALLDVQSFSRIVTEVIKRPYVTVGFIGFLGLIPLAATSNNRAIRKLGPQRWKSLHKLTYPVAVLSALHYFWLVKGWPLEPFIYMAAILSLLALRLNRQRIRNVIAPRKQLVDA